MYSPLVPADGDDDCDALAGRALGAFEQSKVAVVVGALQGCEVRFLVFEECHGRTSQYSDGSMMVKPPSSLRMAQSVISGSGKSV